TTKYCYAFDEGDGKNKALLGGKGANLCEMTQLGLNVPPGFVITTECCRHYLEQDALPEGLMDEVRAYIQRIEQQTGKQFGGLTDPLLVSVRSGSAISMPGMMDSVLNLGLNDETVAQLLKNTDSKRFILDCYRRLIQMYGEVVLGLDELIFEDLIEDFRIQQGVKKDVGLSERGWSQIIEQMKAEILEETGQPYPQDIFKQLYDTVGAVFRSWYSPRAISFRAISGMDEAGGGTAVTIQQMVYGNRSEQSASGVAFTRDPSTGTPGLFGEYLPNVQGEDIVDGFHSPHALSEQARLTRGDKVGALETRMPEPYEELVSFGKKLERRFRDMQEIEFTIEEGKLWLLQTRAAKRTIEVAVRVALDLFDEGLITRLDVIDHVPLDGFNKLIQAVLVDEANTDILTTGLPASPGAACGQICFSCKTAVERANAGEAVVLVRDETNPQDIAGMHAAKAILTRRGGMTSHAADIARAIGRPCIVNARFIELDQQRGTLKVGRQTLNEGDWITIDGSSGHVLVGKVALKIPELDEYGQRFKALLEE
ncbi:MAG: pyruvate, phosphate dikinase, partial [Hyphomicrobiaceae bacterium]|nr:pyruvate, phosphate dikinase [Hyphomicrobiaceae bacterium]